MGRPCSKAYGGATWKGRWPPTSSSSSCRLSAVTFAFAYPALLLSQMRRNRQLRAANEKRRHAEAEEHESDRARHQDDHFDRPGEVGSAVRVEDDDQPDGDRHRDRGNPSGYQGAAERSPGRVTVRKPTGCAVVEPDLVPPHALRAESTENGNRCERCGEQD